MSRHPSSRRSRRMRQLAILRLERRRLWVMRAMDRAELEAEAARARYYEAARELAELDEIASVLA